MILAFTLSMPGCPSWNGRWSGDNVLLAVTRTTRSQTVVDRCVGVHTYAWDDGWRAKITCITVTAPEAAMIRKKSRGFFGYDWMVDNIIRYGNPRGGEHDE